MTTATEYKTQEIADILDIKISRARKLMTLLVQQGKIEALGGNRDSGTSKTVISPLSLENPANKNMAQKVTIQRSILFGCLAICCRK